MTPCPDCAHTDHPGEYVGFYSRSACPTCEGRREVGGRSYPVQGYRPEDVFWRAEYRDRATPIDPKSEGATLRVKDEAQDSLRAQAIKEDLRNWLDPRGHARGTIQRFSTPAAPPVNTDTTLYDMVQRQVAKARKELDAVSKAIDARSLGFYSIAEIDGMTDAEAIDAHDRMCDCLSQVFTRGEPC